MPLNLCHFPNSSIPLVLWRDCVAWSHIIHSSSCLYSAKVACLSATTCRELQRGTTSQVWYQQTMRLCLSGASSCRFVKTSCTAPLPFPIDCLIVANEIGRTLVLNEDGWTYDAKPDEEEEHLYKRGWRYFFNPISTCNYTRAFSKKALFSALTCAQTALRRISTARRSAGTSQILYCASR